MIKILSLFLLAGCLQLSAKTAAQGISISLNNASLSTVFNEIQQQMSYLFVYTNEQLAGASKVTINVQNTSLEKVLELCFRDQPFSYSVVDKFIIVKTKEKKSIVTVSAKNEIRGKVSNEKGEPVAGVTVSLKGSQKATATDDRGEFAMSDVSSGSIIIISSIGYETVEMVIGNNRVLEIHLLVAVSSLDEMVIKGYYSISKRLNTGSVSKLTADDIGKQPVSNPLAAAEGHMPGVTISQSSGTPGTGFTVQIRGQNSLRNKTFDNGNLPLYIVDGVPFTSTTLTSSTNNYIIDGGSPLNFINSTDIESIVVLKDADATSIYGSRGANGVLLITTKKGKPGKTKFDINIYSGIGRITRKIPLLNTQQYLAMRHEALANDGVTVIPSSAYDINGAWDTTRYTDWQKELVGGSAHIVDVQAKISGGDSHTQFLLGSGYHRESTVFPGNFADKKASVYFNLNHSSTDQRLHLTFSANYVKDNNNIIGTDLITQALKLSSDAPAMFTADGKLNWQNSTWNNPAALLLRTYSVNTDNLISDMLISYRLLQGLEVKCNLGYTKMQSNELSTSPIISFKPSNGVTTGSTNFANGNLDSWIAEPQLEYSRNGARFKWSALLGTSFQENNKTTQTYAASGFTSDNLLRNIAAAPRVSVLDNTNIQYRYSAVFGRLNGNWEDKYLCNLTMRRDGSSRFGPGKQFANFGAVGAAWIFTKEKWLEDKWEFLSFGKIRGSYGLTGNDQITDYGWMDTYSTTTYGYQNITGLYPTGLSNTDYSWETNRKMELALELGLWKDRLLFSAGYYRNRSSNQLVGYALPASTGFTTVQKNLDATVQNTGLEFELSSLNIKSDLFTWRTNINLSVPRNKLVSYPNIAGSSYKNMYAVGMPLSVVYALHYTGVNPATGAYTFEDYDRNGSISYPNDLQPLISIRQDYFGGIQNAFNCGDWTVDIFFQFVKQNGRGYMSGGTFVVPGALGNQPTLVLNRWQKPGDTNPVQKFTQDPGSLAYAGYNNTVNNGGDNLIEDASFIRLKNVSLAWSFPKKFLARYKLVKANVYLHAQNLLTFTKLSGNDPENFGSGRIPPLSVLTAGIQLSF